MSSDSSPVLFLARRSSWRGNVVGVREPVAVAGPGFPVVCVLFACCAEFHVVCVFERSAHFSTEVAYRIALLLFPLHHRFTSCASNVSMIQTPRYVFYVFFANIVPSTSTSSPHLPRFRLTSYLRSSSVTCCPGFPRKISEFFDFLGPQSCSRFGQCCAVHGREKRAL